MIRWIQSWFLLALGVALAAYTAQGISYESGGALALAVLLLSLLNAFLKPILILFTLPFVVITLGIGIFLINTLFFWLAGQIIPGFAVDGFWPAVWGAFVVALIHFLSQVLFGKVRIRTVRGNGRSQPPPSGQRRSFQNKKDDNIIDV